MLVFDNIAIPRLVDFSFKGDWISFNKLSCSLLGFTFSLSMLFVILVIFFPKQISLFAIGFDSQQKIILQEKIIWLLPAILLYLPLGASYSILKARRQFSIHNRSEFIGNLSILFFYTFF